MKYTGHYVIILKNQMVFAANELEAISDHITIRLRSIETKIKADDIKVIFETDQTKFPLDPTLLATLTTLEKCIIEHEKKGAKSTYTICGATSLALTIIPNRATEDIDIITAENIDELLKNQNLHFDAAIEFLEPQMLTLMGAWQSRTSQAVGLHGHTFQIMHPLDTIMQKLLRWDQEKFEAKDQPDIEIIIETLNPSKTTLHTLLTENPFRYNKIQGPLSIASDAITRNTQWFLTNYLSKTTLPDIKNDAEQRYTQQLAKAGLLPIPNVDIREKIKPMSPLGLE
jgi:hypothetical protein